MEKPVFVLTCSHACISISAVTTFLSSCIIQYSESQIFNNPPGFGIDHCHSSARAMQLTKDRLNLLNINEIRSVCNKRIKLTRATKTKDSIVDHVMRYASDDLLHDLKNAVADKVDADLPRKLRSMSDQNGDSNRYLDLPDPARVHECYADFYRATSNHAVKVVVCAVCAREVNVEDHAVRVIPLADIPNSRRLVPHCPHAAHKLWDGMLLEHEGFVSLSTGKESINVCGSCYNDLLNSAEDKPPTFSLANNMWIGPVPWQLQILTLPESLLIAHLFPRVYVVKLYPKAYRGTGDGDTLQRGLRGNVSTFELDVKGVENMLQGKLMPRPLAILPRIITLSYIGKGNLPKDLLRSTFRVRRQAVVDALLWLKSNNPKYYGDIDISDERLASLPEDDVPVELSSTIRQSEDTDIIDREHSGYVHDEDQDDLNRNGKSFL